MSQSAGSRRYNDRAGLSLQADAAAWLKQHGFPHAESTRRAHGIDLTGTGDIGVECTLEPWEKIAGKLAEAEGHANDRGLDWFVVWKRRRKTRTALDDPGRHFIVTEARVFWAIAARLGELEALAAVERDEYGRGYRDGVAGRAAEEARA